MDILNGRDEKLISSCYEPTWKHGTARSIGWCATCVPEAKQGEPGYCGKGQNTSPSDDNKEIFEVKPDSTNWGFCDPKCNQKDDDSLLKVSGFQKNFHTRIKWY